MPFFTAWEDTFTMKLLFALLVVSALTLKVEGADIANNAACTDQDTCTDSNAECKADADNNKKCLCKDNYVYDTNTACKLEGGQTCTEATKANCASGTCTNTKCAGTGAKDATCTDDNDCASLNCQLTDGVKKCSKAASALASLTLTLVTLVTTRFL